MDWPSAVNWRKAHVLAVDSESVIRKSTSSTRPTFHSSPIARKKLENFGPLTKKVIGAHVDPPNWTLFGRLYFGS